MASTRESQPFRDAGDGFRLRPSRKRAPRDRPPHQIVQTWARVMRAVAGGNANRSARRSDGSAPRPHSAHRQRCAVRLTYSPNRVAGHFAAHARYLLRDSAAGPDVIHGSIGETPLAEAMGQWQSAGDKRVFKVILSPEFGERIDLGKLASEFIQRIERDLGTALEWAAVNHFDTDHPHVHLVIRGIDGRGHELRFPPRYIKETLRTHAEALCTEQIGTRSPEQIQHARQAEVRLHRFTSLDRLLLQRAELCPDDAAQLRIDLPAAGRAVGSIGHTNELLAARLRFLSDAGVAQPESARSWRIPIDLETMLRTMQNVADRQRMLARTGVAISDDRLPQRITQPRDITALRGRVLGHVENDVTGRVYMVVEGLDGAVHFIPHNDAIERQRAEGHLRPGHFVSLERREHRLRVEDLGDADALLASKRVFPALPHELPAMADRWKGWLGAFHSRLRLPDRDFER